MEVKGKIVAVPPVVTGTSARGPWKKSCAVIEYESGQYPKQIMLTNLNKADEFSKLRVGDTGTFKFDCTVRQANNGNYYQDLNCWSWKIDQPEQSASAPTAAPAAAPAENAGGSDDLPF